MTLRSTSTAADAKRPCDRNADPLGPDSLTWKYFGDLRTGMLGVWIGAIQNMYPELGAGVEDHSILLREPLQRVARSVYPIMGVVYDGDRAAQTGQQIKSYHNTMSIDFPQHFTRLTLGDNTSIYNSLIDSFRFGGIK